MDKLTAQKDMYSFARCLVEIDMAKELTHMVEMKLPNGEILEQPIFYETTPRFCTQCKIIGHTISGCKAKNMNKGKQKIMDTAHGDSGNQFTAPPLDDKGLATEEFNDQPIIAGNGETSKAANDGNAEGKGQKSPALDGQQENQAAKKNRKQYVKAANTGQQEENSTVHEMQQLRQQKQKKQQEQNQDTALAVPADPDEEGAEIMGPAEKHRSKNKAKNKGVDSNDPGIQEDLPCLQAGKQEPKNKSKKKAKEKGVTEPNAGIGGAIPISLSQ